MKFTTVVEPIQHAEAKKFIEQYHYSNRCPTGKNIFFGWYIVFDTKKVLYAVADYGIGVNPYQAQSLQKQTGFPITKDNLVELKRLCRREPKTEKLPLTAFLSKCHKNLKQQGISFVVSFSDPEAGHNGGIYKAANFTYLGKTNAETHAVDMDGIVRHRRLYFRYARRNDVTVKQAREELGLTLRKTQPKDRWLLRIGKDNPHRRP